MRATIENLAPVAREHWGVVTFPRQLVEDFGAECTFETDQGLKWRAVRGRSQGKKTVYRIRTDMIGGETVEGLLKNEMLEAAAVPFLPHPWVADDIGDLIPTIGCRIGTNDYEDVWLQSPQLIEADDAHQRWHLKKWIPQLGIIFEWWADVLSGDPVVPCWGKVVWSDRNDPDPNKNFDFFYMKCGEYFRIDYSQRRGSIQPQGGPGHWMALLTSSTVSLNDGSGLPLSGSMLAFISPGTGAGNDDVPDPEDMSNWVVKSVESLKAAAMGPVLGESHDWDGHWCAAKNLPRHGVGYQDRSDIDVAHFENGLENNVGWFTPGPVGIGMTPGQTGGQEDFGATKGTHVVVHHKPRFIRALQFSIYSELFRGINHYEADGKPLDLAQHPNFVTWSGRNHYHHGVSSDRLGKSSEGPPGTGWWGYDDQHRSQNNFAAYAMLADDPLVDDQVKHYRTTDAASYRMKYPNFGRGACRAQGRVMGAWAQFLTITDGDERAAWLEMCNDRMESIRSNSDLHVSGPMKVLASGGPDGRKPVYLNGELHNWTSFWENGLAIVGLYNQHKQNPTDATHEVLTKICQTQLDFGWFEENGGYYLVADMIYMGGEGPPNGLNLANGLGPGQQNNQDTQFTYGYGPGGVLGWQFIGILIAREFLGVNDASLNSMILQMTGGHESNSKEWAEWWAAVESVI